MAQTRNIRVFIVGTIIFIFMALLTLGCGSNKKEEAPREVISGHPQIQIEMQDGGKMIFELYPEYAPETATNFYYLAKSGFYDGLKFHRIVKGFMVQGGDPKGDGSGGSGKSIKGEFAENGFKQNTLKHIKGVLSMARTEKPNSASSQFFIMHGDVSSLDGKYAAFGKLIEGEAALDKIAETPVELNPVTRELSVPKTAVVMKKVTVLESGK